MNNTAETGVRAQGGSAGWKRRSLLIFDHISLRNTFGGGTLGELANLAVPQSPVL